MVLWRISNYASLEGTGGLLASGRWHTRGRPVVYCAENAATALLEIIVHLEIDADDRPANFRLLRIECPDITSIATVGPPELPENWRENLLLTQSVGDRWLASRKSALLRVPSVIAPETWNLLVNPAHSEAGTFHISSVHQHAFDASFCR